VLSTKTNSNRFQWSLLHHKRSMCLLYTLHCNTTDLVFTYLWCCNKVWSCFPLEHSDVTISPVCGLCTWKQVIKYFY